MPVVEQKAGSCYVWVISTFLFVCLTAGGVLLGIYMSQSDASTWYPIAGIVLVCLPWIFWFLTFLYRVLSRRFGFRMVCWGASVESLPRSSTSTATVAADGGSTAYTARTEQSSTATMETATGSTTTATDGGRRVRFGGAVVLGDEHNNESGRMSPESEAPLKYSMAS